MKLFVCIDDTDNIDSIGTGELLENMMKEAEMRNLAKGGFIVRYQLFIHEDIAYTSHNSSMCCEAETDDRQAFTDFCKEYIAYNSAEGSDPGLCILTCDRDIDYAVLLEYGLRAQSEVLKKEDAVSLADSMGEDVFLAEIGGTGDGIIGALAGAALRAGKAEGRIKGKVYPQKDRPEWTLSEFSKDYGIQCFEDEEGKEIKGNQVLVFSQPTKFIFRNGMVTCVLVNDNGVLIPKLKVKKKEK